MIELPDNVHVAIPSYRRAGLVSTLDVAPFAYVWVPESQQAEYEEHYPGRVIGVPDELDGNVCKKRNAILDRAPGDWVVMMDDDVTSIRYWESGGEGGMNPEHLAEFIVDMFGLTSQIGARLWGVNQNYDPLLYRVFTPLSLLAPCLGPFTGHIKSPIRYDERMILKEDYDYWLQHVRKYRHTVRFNKVHYYHDHGGQLKGLPGGIASQRTIDREWECARAMQRKWGPLFRPCGAAGGKNATGKNVMNSKVSVPLKGC